MPLVDDINPWTGKPEQVWEPDEDWFKLKRPLPRETEPEKAEGGEE